MGLHEVEASFNAIDNMSSVVRSIGDNIATMAGVAGQAISGLGSGFDEAGAALQAVATGPMGAAMFAFNEIGKSMIEVRESMTAVGARTGLTGDALQALQDDAKALFATGFVDNFDEAAQIMEKMHTDLGGVNSDNVAKLAKDVAAVAAAWGTQGDKVIDGIDALQSKFAALADKPQLALDILVKTAQNSHEPIEKISKLVDQFGSKFAAAGVSAIGMGGLIATGANIGISNFGALATALDAFHQKVMHPPSQFLTAMRQLGLGDVVSDLQKNKISMDDALQKVFVAFDKLPDGPKKAQLAVELFGKGIDKIGGSDVIGKLKDFKQGFDDVGGAADRVGQAMSEGSFGRSITAAFNTAKMQIGTTLDQITTMINAIGWDKAIGVVGEAIKQKVGETWNDVQTRVSNNVSLITALINRGDWAAAISAATGGLSTAATNAFGAVRDTASRAFDGVKTNVSSNMDAIKVLISKGDWAGAIDALAPGIGTAAGKVFNGVQKIASDAWGTIKNTVSNSITAIWQWITKSSWDTAIIGVMNNIKTWVENTWNGLVDFVNGIVGKVKAAFDAVANAIVSALGPVAKAVGEIVDGIKYILGHGGKPGGGDSGGGGVGFGATGGDLNDGLTIVGEEGPEMISKRGGVATVFSNRDTRQILGSGGGASGGGGGVTIHVTVGTLVGSGGMDEFARTLKASLQREDQRRGAYSG